jgi:hypothetical protein
LKSISRLRGLTFLELNSTRITDEGLASIATMSRLTGLGVSDTAVTNAGLVRLRPLNQLSWFTYSGSRITDDAAEQFQKYLREPQTKTSEASPKN